MELKAKKEKEMNVVKKISKEKVQEKVNGGYQCRQRKNIIHSLCTYESSQPVIICMSIHDVHKHKCGVRLTQLELS